jgi:L-lactate utilization protein LutC
VRVADDAVVHFMERLRAQGGQCSRVENADAARAWLAAMAGDELSPMLIADDPWIEQILALPGSALPAAEVALDGRIEGLAVTTAIAAVAETGSVLLHPRAGAPMAMNFLCDRLVVLLRAADVLQNLEDMWARVRQSFGNNTPRALSLVSGPSSSGDIGMQFATGVHGPIELHVLVVDS